MRKSATVAVVLMAACGMLRADQLSDAQRSWENKDFATAFQRFSVLAERGVPAAQLQLGEMYGFGEGTAQNLEQAVRWLSRAQAAGNPDAAESLLLVRERSRRKDEIAYYTSRFDGAALRYENFQCVRPVIPAVSKTNQEIKAVNDTVIAWSACYGRFVQGLNRSLPATNTIPPDVLKLMSNDEYARASELITRTGQQLAVEPQQLANAVLAENQAWKTATDKYVADSNISLANQATKQKMTYDILNREIDNDFRNRQDIARSRKSGP